MYHAFPYLTDSKDMLSLERQIELVSLALLYSSSFISRILGLKTILGMSYLVLLGAPWYLAGDLCLGVGAVCPNVMWTPMEGFW